jgi:hypothetical protein
MFEFLRSISPSNVDLFIWQSTIRYKANVLDEYRCLQAWPGSETADIVYPDSSSVLTTRLISCGYLQSELWRDAKPTYYIEVKTTTEEHEHPFFCSQKQFDMMESMRLSNDKVSGEVYIIARVFKLGKEGMGYRLYVDPATLKAQGRLKFESNQYAVTPNLPR